MKKLNLLIILAALFTFVSCSDDDKKTEDVIGNKEGVLLVTFGSSFDAPKETYNKIDAQIKKSLGSNFSSKDFYWSYTSHIIRNILLKKGDVKNSTKEALEQMKKDGFGKITLQSLHVIPGQEYQDLQKTVSDFNKSNPAIKTQIGTPLMNTEADLDALAKILVDEFKSKTDAGNIIVLMGHGTHHAGDAKYADLQKAIDKFSDKFIIGTVEGHLTLKNVLTKLGEKSASKVVLTPLMSIAGDHANNDMAGAEDANTVDEDEKSWKYHINKSGITVEILLKGLGDYEKVNEIWLNHLKEAQAKF